MPLLSRIQVRTALIFLALGALSGATLMVEKASALSPMLWLVLPLHIEWMLIGWALQLAFGVAWWLLPRLEDNTRGRPVASWGSWGLLNGGLVLRALDQALDLAFGGFGGLLSDLGIALELLAVVLFAFAVWRRVGFVPEEIRQHREKLGRERRSGDDQPPD